MRSRFNVISRINSKYWDIGKLFEYVMTAFVFCIPFSLRTLIYQSPLSSNGFFDAFSSQFLYVQDCILIIALLLFSIGVFTGRFTLRYHDSAPQRIFWFFIIILYILLVGTAYFAYDPKLTFFTALRSLLYIFTFYVFSERYFDIFRAIQLLVYSMLLQTGISVLQYVLQHSVGLQFLGEPYFDQATLGIAKIDVDHEKYIRSYGTFLHPNVLGGFALFIGSLSLFLYKKLQQKRWLFFSAVIGIAFILSFSRSAVMGLVFGLWIYFWIINPRINMALSKRKIIIGTILSLIILFNSQIGNLLQTRLTVSLNEQSVRERINYMQMSYGMIEHEPWGIGANHFTLRMQEFTGEKLLPWEHQPVHNVFLLMANELGLLGGTILIALIIWFSVTLYTSNLRFHTTFDRSLNHLLLFFIAAGLMISFVDHYFITNSSMMYLLAVIAPLCSFSLEGSVKTVKAIRY